MSAIKTGRVIYGNLQQVYQDTGEPTEQDPKVNDPDDPDYVPPQVDTEECPPDTPPTPDMNKVRVQFVNNTTQAVALTNVTIKGEAIADLSKAYYKSTSVSLLPSKTITGSTVNQLDDLVRALMTVNALSKNIRIKIDAQYKLATDSSYSSVFHQSYVSGDSVSMLLSMPRISGNGINMIRFVITEDPIGPTPDNDPPIVDAGANQTVILPTSVASLSGSASDPDGTIVSTTWTQMSGPTVATISAPGSTSTTVGNLIEGVYIFRLTAVDNESASAYDNVTVTVQPAVYNPNGIVNLLVDPAMPDNTNAVSQVTLRKTSDLTTTTLLSSSVNKTNGVLHFTPLKGVFNVEVQVVVSGSARSVKLEWGASQVIIKAATSGTYVFENVTIDEGVSGLNITYSSEVLSGAIVPVYAKLVATTPVIESEATAPFGLMQTGRGNVTVSFYTDSGATTPVAFTGTLRIKTTTTDHITSGTSVGNTAYTVNAALSIVISTIQSLKQWDYTLNDPAVAEDPADKIQDVSYAYEVVGGQGYLIIP